MSQKITVEQSSHSGNPVSSEYKPKTFDKFNQSGSLNYSSIPTSVNSPLILAKYSNIQNQNHLSISKLSVFKDREASTSHSIIHRANNSFGPKPIISCPRNSILNMRKGMSKCSFPQTGMMGDCESMLEQSEVSRDRFELDSESSYDTLFQQKVLEHREISMLSGKPWPLVIVSSSVEKQGESNGYEYSQERINQINKIQKMQDIPNSGLGFTEYSTIVARLVLQNLKEMELNLISTKTTIRL